MKKFLLFLSLFFIVGFVLLVFLFSTNSFQYNPVKQKLVIKFTYVQYQFHKSAGFTGIRLETKTNFRLVQPPRIPNNSDFYGGEPTTLDDMVEVFDSDDEDRGENNDTLDGSYWRTQSCRKRRRQ